MQVDRDTLGYIRTVENQLEKKRGKETPGVLVQPLNIGILLWRTKSALYVVCALCYTRLFYASTRNMRQLSSSFKSSLPPSPNT